MSGADAGGATGPLPSGILGGLGGVIGNTLSVGVLVAGATSGGTGVVVGIVGVLITVGATPGVCGSITVGGGFMSAPPFTTGLRDGVFDISMLMGRICSTGAVVFRVMEFGL